MAEVSLLCRAEESSEVLSYVDGVWSFIRVFLIMRRSSSGSGGHGPVKEVAVWDGKVAAVLCAAEHSIAEQFACASQFFTPAFPPIVRYRQIQ